MKSGIVMQSSNWYNNCSVFFILEQCPWERQEFFHYGASSRADWASLSWVAASVGEGQLWIQNQLKEGWVLSDYVVLGTPTAGCSRDPDKLMDFLLFHAKSKFYFNISKL